MAWTAWAANGPPPTDLQPVHRRTTRLAHRAWAVMALSLSLSVCGCGVAARSLVGTVGRPSRIGGSNRRFPGSAGRATDTHLTSGAVWVDVTHSHGGEYILAGEDKAPRAKRAMAWRCASYSSAVLCVAPIWMPFCISVPFRSFAQDLAFHLCCLL